MNKTILVVFAVAVCAVAAISAVDIDEDLVDQALRANGLTPEQKRCIADAVEKSNEEHPELTSWLNEVDAARKALEAKAEKCQQLQNPLEKRKCLIQVKIEAKREWVRLVTKLKPEQRKALGLLKKEIRKCLKK